MNEKRENYEVVIGLEVHAELATKTKAYCSCSTEFGKDPNTLCCPVCTGMPGALPVINEKVIEYAVKMGLATNSQIARFSKQDRKNYFYPDLPKAYQISQYDLPLCQNGFVIIPLLEQKKKIGITRIHIEEDAGKLSHDDVTGCTLVDLNRSSVPLIEIVSEPDIRSSKEAVSYMQTIKGILEYLEICDCKMEEGSLRCDVNLSVMKKGSSAFGTRTETKNLNSFKAIEACIEFEIDRQIEVLEQGGKIDQETRRFDDVAGIGYAMRTKENANDYRYFEEPDLEPIVLTQEYIENFKNTLPELPNSRKERYEKEYNLSPYDSMQITSNKVLADYFDQVVKKCGNAKAAINWMIGDFARCLKEAGISIKQSKVVPENLAALISLIDQGTISSTIAKQVFNMMFETGKNADEIVKEQGLLQITDRSEIEKIVHKVVDDNEQSVIDYHRGKDRALGFLVGQVMKQSKGKASPTLVNELVLKELVIRGNQTC